MLSIQKSFANCAICPLLNSPSCIAETNCEKDISKVDVLIVAENPGKDEVKANPPRPLIGKAGQLFRKYFQKYKIDKLNYFLTNIVLCQTMNQDGTTGNPTEEIAENCKENVLRFIEYCNPKLIVLMGATPTNTLNVGYFEMGNVGITKKRGNFFKEKINDKIYDVFVMVHPSYVNRNRSFESKFEDDMKLVYSFLTGEKMEKKNEIKTSGIKGQFLYKLPKHFYTDEYRLVDVQNLSQTNEVLFIFRDKNNKKIFHKESDRYVAYIAPSNIEAKKIVPYTDLEQISLSYRDKYSLDPDITYEGDLRITTKHAIDYYMQSQGEAIKVKPNIMYLDIEVDMGDIKAFPKPTEAKFPINLITIISTSSVEKTVTYILDNKTEPIKEIEGVEFKIFKNEKSLLLQLIRDFPKYDCDYITGWNVISFDMEYIFNRLKNLHINYGDLSPFKTFYIDGLRYICSLPGYVVLDQLYLYKMLTFTKKESYKLGYIAQEELGETKIELPYAINEMYWKMLNKTIEYNVKDVDLLVKLENKLKHISLLDEIRTICNTSFDGGSSEFGQVDSIIVSFLKKKGMASKNSNPHDTKVSYPGAFVLNCIPGIYSSITDFDFTSLYPSIISSYNIGINSFVMKLKDSHYGYDLTYHPENLPEKLSVILDPSFENKEVVIDKNDLIKQIEKDNLIFTINGCFFKSHEDEMSFYSTILEGLLSSRKAYKKKMFEAKDEFNLTLFNTKQLVYKVLANSLYGVVANKSFRFFDISCAAAVTLSGQESLKNTIIWGNSYMEHLKTGKDYIDPDEITKEEMYGKFERVVKYLTAGDTDSVFLTFEQFKDKSNENIRLLCNKIQTFLNNKIGEEIVKKHNADLKYNKLNLKNELIISRGLFLAKKQYAIHVIERE